jgi:hypothetical protein
MQQMQMMIMQMVQRMAQMQESQDTFCQIWTKLLAWPSRYPPKRRGFSEQQRPPVRPCSPGPCRVRVPSESFPVPARCPAAPTPARIAPHAAGEAARDGLRPSRARGPMAKPNDSRRRSVRRAGLESRFSRQVWRWRRSRRAELLKRRR